MTFSGKSARGLVPNLLWFYSWSRSSVDFHLLSRVVEKGEEVANHSK